ncbi:MAG TPA: single-stranded DNA-binding protein [Candidatus Paceibacterota bacterium]
MYLNKAFVFGNLTRDPEVRSLPSGVQVASFGLATNRVYKKDGKREEMAEFHNIVVFGKQAELAAQYLKKGSSLLVEGRIQTRSWEGEKGKQYRTEIVAERIQFGPRGGGAGGGGGTGGGAAPTSKAGPAKEKKEDTIEYPEDDINPEDIPF